MKEYCVCCSVCGGILQKSGISLAEIKCSNCGTMLRVHVKDGVVIVAEKASLEKSRIYGAIKGEIKIE